MKIKRYHALAFALSLSAAGDLPTEFRLFKAGWNETENGQYLFDDAAAKAVMANAAAWNVDLMIDLEHQALTSEIPVDPTARDARGWFRLELREDGSLWATNVSWTEDGAARLREKRQRYISPAFDIDDKGRVTKIINVAITAIPATHGTPPLVAASARALDRRTLSAGSSFADVQCALSAALRQQFPAQDGGELCSGGPWILDVFDATFVYELAGKLFEAPYTFDGSVATIGAATEVKRSYAPIAAPAPAAPPPVANRITAAKMLAAGEAKMLDAKQIQAALDAIANGDEAKALEILKGIIATAAGGTAEPAGEPPAPDPQAESMMAAARVALSLTGKSTPAEAIAELTRLVGLAVDFEKKEQKLAQDRAALEATERRQLCAQLVKLGVEIPATAWEDDKGTIPCKRLRDEPIADLRDRVSKLSAVRGGSAPPAVPPNAGAAAGGAKRTRMIETNDGPVELTASEVDACEDAAKKNGGVRTVDEVLTAYATNKAARAKK